jgi:hypothetical protein
VKSRWNPPKLQVEFAGNASIPSNPSNPGGIHLEFAGIHLEFAGNASIPSNPGGIHLEFAGIHLEFAGNASIPSNPGGIHLEFAGIQVGLGSRWIQVNLVGMVGIWWEFGGNNSQSE